MARLPFLVRAFKGSNPFVPFLVSIAQLVEHQVVVLRVMGSIPITHPKLVIENFSGYLLIYFMRGDKGFK